MLRRPSLILIAAMSGAIFSMHVQAASATDAWSKLQQQANAGDVKAEVALAHHLYDSKNPADKTAGVAWFRKAALQGDTDAQWMLGNAYMGGVGVTRDPAQALEWMRKGLADGSADHMASFGMLLGLQGMFNGKDNESLQWIQRSADAGSSRGMMMLAMLQLNGRWGATRDPAAAEQWFLKAANKGDAEAQMVLGAMYLNDTFGRTDVVAGLRWLHQAARQGHVDAQATLAYYLISGDKDVPKNPAEGVQWADKAASKNNALGHYALGLAYQYGGGEPRDPARAWYHFAVASRLDAKHQLSKVNMHMSEVATQLSVTTLALLQAKAEQTPLPATPGNAVQATPGQD